MPASPLPVTLTDDERAQLHLLMHRGKTSARIRTRADVTLKLDAGWSESQICAAVAVAPETIRRTRKRFATGRLDAVLHDQRQERYRQALAGEQIAHLIAIACTPVPDGHDHWTLRMLGAKAVELGYVSHICPETIRQALKKTN